MSNEADVILLSSEAISENVSNADHSNVRHADGSASHQKLKAADVPSEDIYGRVY